VSPALVMYIHYYEHVQLAAQSPLRIPRSCTVGQPRSSSPRHLTGALTLTAREPSGVVSTGLLAGRVSKLTARVRSYVVAVEQTALYFVK